MWTPLFDRSKTLDGAGAGNILKDTSGKRTLIACRIAFQCTNNVVEYEALMKGIKKEVNINMRKIKEFGDS
jgi:ribonuclease HI